MILMLMLVLVWMCAIRFNTEYPVEKLYRDSRIYQIYGSFVTPVAALPWANLLICVLWPPQRWRHQREPPRSSASSSVEMFWLTRRSTSRREQCKTPKIYPNQTARIVLELV